MESVTAVVNHQDIYKLTIAQILAKEGIQEKDPFFGQLRAVFFLPTLIGTEKATVKAAVNQIYGLWAKRRMGKSADWVKAKREARLAYQYAPR